MATSSGSNARDIQMNLDVGSRSQRNALQIGGGNNNTQYNAKNIHIYDHHEPTSFRELARWLSPTSLLDDRHHVACGQCELGTGT